MRSTLLLVLITCIGGVPFSLSAEQTLVAFEVDPLAEISYQLPTPLQKAVKSSQEWNALWREMQAHRTDEKEENDGPRDAPKVDFKRHTLLIVAAGARPSGGYLIAFHSVREYESHIDVTAYELRPFGKQCTAIAVVTYPVAFALIPRTVKSVRFQLEHADLTCGP
jgi:hypothetical protein